MGDMSDIGRGISNMIVTGLIAMFIAGVGIGVGGYFFISWLIHHISIAWV